MSTLKTTYIQHPDATGPAIELTAAGTVALPLSGIGDLADVDVGSGASDGDVLTYDATGDLWIPQGVVLPAGIGSNVVSATKTDTFSTASTSFVDITDLSVTITPTSATSKILVLATIHAGSSGNVGNVNVVLVRNAALVAIGDAAGSRISATTGRYWSNGSIAYAGMHSLGVNYLDNPASTSATTYKLQISTGTGFTAYVNRSGRDSDDGFHRRLVSTITAIEVAA